MNAESLVANDTSSQLLIDRISTKGRNKSKQRTIQSALPGGRTRSKLEKDNRLKEDKTQMKTMDTENKSQAVSVSKSYIS